MYTDQSDTMVAAQPPSVVTGALPSKQPRESIVGTALLLALLGLVLYALGTDFQMLGDAVLYADYMRLGKFDEITLHLGYYLTGYAVDRVIGAPFGIPLEQSLVWLNVVCGALSLGLAYVLARDVLGRRDDAIRTVLLFAVGGRVLFNATTSEIYMLQTVLVLASFTCFAKERVIWAGIFGALALYVSPLSAFAYLFFPVFDYQRFRKIRWRVLFTLAGVALALYMPYLIVYGNELLYGRRGLLIINANHEAATGEGLVQFARYQVKLFTASLLLLLPFFFVVTRYRRLLVLALAVGLPHLYIILKLRSEDNVFIMNTDFFLALCLGTGWGVASRAGYRVVSALPFVLHVALFGLSRQFIPKDRHVDAPMQLQAIARRYLVGQPAVMITDWSHTMLLTNYGRLRSDGKIEDDALYAQVVDVGVSDEVRLKVRAAEYVYVLDVWEPGALIATFSSQDALARMTDQFSIVRVSERDYGLACRALESSPYRVYRCDKRAQSDVMPEGAR